MGWKHSSGPRDQEGLDTTRRTDSTDGRVPASTLSWPSQNSHICATQNVGHETRRGPILHGPQFFLHVKVMQGTAEVSSVVAAEHSPREAQTLHCSTSLATAHAARPTRRRLKGADDVSDCV